MTPEKKDRFSIVNKDDPLWPEEYHSATLAPGHCRDVLMGSYDIPWWPEKPPIILDIGANVGAFIRWAVQRWPDCTIHAYEPEPNNFRLLKATCARLQNVGQLYLNNVAIDRNQGTAILKNFGHNCGEFSLYPMPGETPKGDVEVDVKAAKDLPVADIIKIDAEGAEAVILPALRACGKLDTVGAVMVEYHNEQDGKDIQGGLELAGFELIGSHVMAQHRGELQFMRTKLLEKLYP